MMKLVHKVPGIPCYIEYEIEPDEDYVRRFTDLKRETWPEIQGPIDAYIGQSTMQHISEASSIRRRRRARSRDVYAARLQKLIDAEVNRGLAIIAINDRVEVKFASGYSIVNKQPFENAIGRLLKAMNGGKLDNFAFKKRQCRYWADSCAFEIAQAFFGRRLPK